MRKGDYETVGVIHSVITITHQLWIVIFSWNCGNR